MPCRWLSPPARPYPSASSAHEYGRCHTPPQRLWHVLGKPQARAPPRPGSSRVKCQVTAQSEQMLDPHGVYSPVADSSLAYIIGFRFFIFKCSFSSRLSSNLDAFLFFFPCNYMLLFFVFGFPALFFLFYNVPGTGLK